MDRSLLDEAFEGRWPFSGGQIAMVCYGRFDAGTLPSVGSVVTSLGGAEQEDVGAIDSGVLAELPERLDDGPVDAVGGEIDEMRRDAGDEGFERDARLQRARALGKRPRIGPQPKEQIGQIPQQQNRREVEQESGSPGASLDAGVIVEISALQRPRPLRRLAVQDAAKNPVHLGQRVQDKTPVCDQRIRVGREPSARQPDQPVQRGFRFRCDLVVRLAHELEHRIHEGADFRRDGVVSAEIAARVREVRERVLQQRVVGLEGLDQSFLFGGLGDELAQAALDVGAVAAVRCCARDPQNVDAIADAQSGLDQRIVIREQPGACPQHVAVKGGIIQGQLVQRLQDALVHDRIGACGAHKKVSQRQQQTREDRHQPPDRPGHGERPASGPRGRPRYSPVSVRRNATIRSISGAVRDLPS